MYKFTSALAIVNFVLILSLTMTSVIGAEGPRDEIKSRRGGSMTLYPQPRVGRSQIGRSWLVNPEELGYFHEIKKQGLIPFPRVGRAMNTNDNFLMGGLWIVPRPGKLSRRKNENSDDAPLPIFSFRDVALSHDFTPRLGREPEESTEDEQPEQMDQI